MAKRDRKAARKITVRRARVQAEIAPKLDAALHRLAELADIERERERQNPDYAAPEWASLSMILHHGLCTRPPAPWLYLPDEGLN